MLGNCVQDLGGMHDTSKLSWMAIEDVTLLLACAPPNGGRQVMSQRFTRHFAPLCMPNPSEVVMRHIFEGVLGGFLSDHFSGDVGAALTKPMVASTVEAFGSIASSLLPTPAKSHYTFNLRDVSKVFQVQLHAKAALPSL